MANIVQGSDIDPSPIMGVRLAMLGYGNQGRSQALNLRDSGVDVRIGLYPESKRWSVAVEDGFEVLHTPDAVAASDFLMLCLPDTRMAGIYRNQIEPFLNDQHTITFCHGFNIRFELIKPPVGNDVILIAPKGTGPSLRRDYEAGKGVPALAAVHQDATGRAREMALAYAAAVGAAKSFVVETTFSDETEADLFGEQAILCGGLPELIKAGMKTLIDGGISPEVAYFECLHDCKTVMDLIYERGFAGMRSSISETAQWGGLTVGPELIDEGFKTKLGGVYEAIRDGSFAREWVAETEAGTPELERLRQIEAAVSPDPIARGLRRN